MSEAAGAEITGSGLGQFGDWTAMRRDMAGVLDGCLCRVDKRGQLTAESMILGTSQSKNRMKGMPMMAAMM
ncbi:MAG: hypothetical protein KTV68_03585 [Acidimicrobiia bacterium]|nr:hypothetical protein [Acidimicrobiia bacterium]MCY4435223.1 hypothetical protein [bacterium]